MPDTITQVTLVSERAGSTVWKVRMAGGDTVAVKYTTGDDGPVRQFAYREACVMTHVDRFNLFAWSDTRRGTWLAVEWEDAPSLAHRWQHADADRATALAAAAQAAGRLAALHASGWLHADLQPAHILCPDQGPARLIDWALAQGPADDVPPIAYRGGYAHLTAPEIAAELLDTPATHHVTLRPAAEVYTFGASIFASWTKQWPVDYQADPATHSAPDIYEAIARPGARRPMPDGWPDLATLLSAMLEPEARHRPTMSEIHEALTHLATL